MKAKSMFFRPLLCLLFLLPTAACPATTGKIIYVDDNAVGLNDGSSWQNAYTFLQDALADANSAEKPVEIRIAQGIYRPDRGTGQTPRDREATFQLINDVNLTGGYAGLGQYDPNARDIELYQTILSGDLNGDDIETDDPCDLLDEPTRAENSYHVVTGSNTNETAILDGFIITAGNANGSPTYSYGGGIFNDTGNPTLANCIIRRNFATFGGGIACGNFSNPEITNCTINENLATLGGGGIGCSRNSSPMISNCLINSNTSMTDGGGIFLINSNAIIIDCTISDNRAWSYGGGIFCEHMAPTISNCLITGNVAEIGGGGVDCFVSNSVITNCTISRNRSIQYHGGGIYCGWSSPSIVNCLITANESAVDGGGIHCFSSIYGQSSPTVTSCTIANNFAERGGGGICCENSSTLTATNCIVWENMASYDPQIFSRNADANLLLSNCNVQGGWPGEGNIDLDPLFADPIKGDYHLKSQAGRWDPNRESWIFDYITSPCIDAGDPNMPVGEEPEPNGGRINMGAYGGTPEASKSYILAKIIYVDDDAVGLNDGTNWENAYTFLQDALAEAKSADKPVEIRVAQGIYKPNQRMLQTPDDGDNTFTLFNEVTVKGGYAGFGDPDPNARDIETCETILSGDLNGDDIVVDDPCDMLLVQSNRADNSSVVVRAYHTDATAVLDGFVITGGYFKHMYTGPPNGGAGMHIYQGSPTILNCTFTGNAARQIGGGLLNRGGSNPTLVNCAFTGNYAESGGGIYNTPNMPAPGMISEGSHPTLVNCTFDNNCALKNGGGMYNFRSDLTLTDCTFRRNQVIRPYSGSRRGPHSGGGGGMYNSNSNPVLTDCLFSENSAGIAGGICSAVDSNVTLNNCTFNGNSASSGGGGLSNPKDCSLMLTNCKFISNSAKQWGGGMANGSSNTILVDCIFIGNKAHDWSMAGVPYTIPGQGGGMSTGGNPTIINCTFRLNYATKGAGIYLSGSPELIGCIFTGNSAIEDGGGIHNIDTFSEPSITNCTFSGNSANRGGGIFFTWGARMTMANCTFAGNFASIGNTLASEPTKPSLPGYIELTNCILWDGDNTIFDPEPYALRSAITYSNVQGGWPGEGNIDADPCFANPGYWADVDDPNITVEPNDPNAVWVEGDYHLKSQAGRWDPHTQSWVQDDVTSPCIDAGDPNSPIGQELFPNGGIINMGAYGGTPEASLSPLIGQASNPNPPDGAIGVSPNVILSWSPGKNAIAHDVYFGMYLNSDINATRENPLGLLVSQGQDANFYDPSQLRPQGMLYTQERCYWRIDEIDSQGNITTGDIWKFQVYEYKGRLCFTGQTPVWINDSFTPISKVGVGQSIDGINRVEQVQEHKGTYTLFDILLESGNSITVAENHIFMTEAGNWLSLHELKAGTRLKTLNGSIGIQSVTKQPAPFTGKVYNLKIQGSDRYMVGKDMVIVRDY